MKKLLTFQISGQTSPGRVRQQVEQRRQGAGQERLRRDPSLAGLQHPCRERGNRCQVRGVPTNCSINNDQAAHWWTTAGRPQLWWPTECGWICRRQSSWKLFRTHCRGSRLSHYFLTIPLFIHLSSYHEIFSIVICNI